jgi:hypothetical protein
MAAKKEIPTDPVTVRMLVDKTIEGVHYKANQAVIYPPALGVGLVNAGEADDQPEAVAYAESETGPAIVHKPKADQEA